MGKYSGLLYCNEFFVSLLILTAWGIWIFVAEYEFYALKNSGERVIGKIVQFNVVDKKSLQVKYMYYVGGKEYVGSRFYRNKNHYDSGEIENLIKQINEENGFTVYYASDSPGNSVCFVTDETLRMDRSGIMIIIALWGIFGLGYLQVRIWNRN
ncbi:MULTISPECIES: hypothetical protein [Bacteroidales]|uniref:hypothetical protein n=1 Tax=Bacteroidales TaxID=171549 RepID=UPI00259B345E|nr:MULTISPECIES: hypothetical protein [Bacteroidales]